MILSFALWFGGLVWFIEDMPQGTPNPTLKTNAIVVLTGGNNRISEGLTLLSQNKSNQLLISGVRQGASLKAIVKGSGYRGSFDPRKVALDYKSTTTVENAQNVATWAKRKQVKSIRLVTANYHMRRALIEFNHYMKSVKIVPHAINPLDSGENAWCKDYKIFCLYLNEYHKYLGAFARMKIQRVYKKDL
tara:strand:+ start:3621 stop:4190 length:570 start_codon:yes stop_codon:yes gene_type:complete